MSKPKCSVSIVTYHNPPEVVLAAVQSCLKSECSEQVYVVDNSSVPDLQIALQGLPVDYDFTGENLGFGKAHNRAMLHKPMGKYHLILNPDVVFESGTLEALIDFMESCSDIAITIPKVLFRDGQMQYLCRRLLPTPEILIGRRFLPSFITKRKQAFYERYELRDKDPDEVMDVPCVSGCFMMVRAHVLLSAGGFDERYFMYMEDVDLCRRIGKSARIVYYPKVSIQHGWARESYRNFKLLRMHIVSAIKYFNKWGWRS